MSNRAAVFQGTPYFTVENTAIPTVPKNKILVKTVAYAANPTDWKHVLYKLGEVGSVVGSDYSGIVEEVGADVEGFAKGDYVAGSVHGAYEKGVGAFQDYVVADPGLVAKFDKSVFKTEPLPVGDSPSGPINTFEGAASLGVAIITIGCSFPYGLNLSPEDASNKENYILIWGGATATGVIAIQFAKHVYGLNVITAASAKHTDFLKSLGADHVIDYNNDDAVAQIKAIGGKNLHYALDTVGGPQTWQSIYDATSEVTEGNVYLDNLLMLGPAQIKADSSRTNVKYAATLAYIANGDSTKFGEHEFVPTDESVQKFRNYWKNILPGFIPKLKHANLKVLKAGLASGEEGLTLLKEGKVSGQKIVFRAD